MKHKKAELAKQPNHSSEYIAPSACMSSIVRPKDLLGEARGTPRYLQAPEEIKPIRDKYVQCVILWSDDLAQLLMILLLRSCHISQKRVAAVVWILPYFQEEMMVQEDLNKLKKTMT